MLDLVEQGEVVIITRHGEQVARLVPARPIRSREQARAAIRGIRDRAEQRKLGPFDWSEWVTAMWQRGIAASEAVMVGDRNSDVEAGRALGLTTYLVETGYGAAEKHATSHSCRCGFAERGQSHSEQGPQVFH